MKKLLAIGEALVDIFDNNIRVGGAPLNVCAAYSKLGEDAYFIGKLSTDNYGNMILNKMNEVGIKTDYVSYTSIPTGKAIVKTLENGEREFVFERNNCADQLLNEFEVKEEWFKDAFALHFCSVSLDDYPIKKAHDRAIEYAKKYNCLISFDLNIRPSLFDNHNKLRNTIYEYIRHANILKLSVEDLEFLGKEKHIYDLFVGDVEIIILTLGKEGCTCYFKNKEEIYCPGIEVKSIDTTGAGDAFIGSFLYQLENLKSTENFHNFLKFSNLYSAISVTRVGAIDSYITNEEMKRLI
jgi:fructokinase